MNEEVNNNEPQVYAKKKKEKNLISLAILLAGLFIGSLFVDLSQLIKGGGISQKVLNNKDVFQLDGRTWVAYADPIIDVTIVNDEDCEECNVDEALVWLRKIVPTMLANKIEYDSSAGEEIISDFDIKYLPVFVFSKDIEGTEFYAQAKPLFEEKNGKYVLDAAKIGLPSGKYIQTPEVRENSITIGPDDAEVKLIEFSDFQCPYCQLFHETVGGVLEEYGDQVQLVFKHLPLDSIHPRARDAALASECANEQGEFKGYADKLFANQESWGKTENNTAFSNYAFQLGLNTSQFNECLEEGEYKSKIESNLQEATEFGVSGTPAIFIGDSFKSGAVQADELKAIIDEKLGSPVAEEESSEVSDIIKEESAQ
jgi:protein-disulfide isomerase